MENLIIALNELKNTPVPTILVVGGVLLLILGLIGKLAAYVEMSPKRQMASGLAGILLLLSGIILYIAPALTNNTPLLAISNTPVAATTQPQSPALSSTSTGSQAPPNLKKIAILYEEDFEDGVADGWDEISVGWGVVDDGAGNKVYRGQAGSDFIVSGIGSTTWSNYEVEFRTKAVERRGGDAGGNVAFRAVWDTSEYGLSFSFTRNVASLYVAYPTPVRGGVKWGYKNIAGSAEQDIGLRENEWSSIQIEVIDNFVQGTVNGIPFWGYDDSYKRGMVYFNVGPQATILFDDIQIWSIST